MDVPPIAIQSKVSGQIRESKQWFNAAELDTVGVNALVAACAWTLQSQG
jgi:hypothetical protein